MKASEFRQALELAFGPIQGDSLARDLHLPAFDSTADEALDKGVAPKQVWKELCRELDVDSDTRWIRKRSRRVGS